jgi:hypothetical protein
MATLTTGKMFFPIHLYALLGVRNFTNVFRVRANCLWSGRRLPSLRNAPLASVSRPSLEAHPASYSVGTGGKARLGRDANHSPQSSAEVKNE